MGQGGGCESPLVFPSLFLDGFLVVPFDVAIRSCLLLSARLSLILSPALRNKRAGPRPALHLVNIAQLEAHRGLEPSKRGLPQCLWTRDAFRRLRSSQTHLLQCHREMSSLQCLNGCQRTRTVSSSLFHFPHGPAAKAERHGKHDRNYAANKTRLQNTCDGQRAVLLRQNHCSHWKCGTCCLEGSFFFFLLLKSLIAVIWGFGGVGLGFFLPRDSFSHPHTCTPAPAVAI